MEKNHLVVVGDSRKMAEVPSASVQLVVTSPPYFNVKDYGVENIGSIDDFHTYLQNMQLVFDECILSYLAEGNFPSLSTLVACNRSMLIGKLSRKTLSTLDSSLLQDLHTYPRGRMLASFPRDSERTCSTFLNSTEYDLQKMHLLLRTGRG